MIKKGLLIDPALLTEDLTVNEITEIEEDLAKDGLVKVKFLSEADCFDPERALGRFDDLIGDCYIFGSIQTVKRFDHFMPMKVAGPLPDHPVCNPLIYSQYKFSLNDFQPDTLANLAGYFEEPEFIKPIEPKLFTGFVVETREQFITELGHLPLNTKIASCQTVVPMDAYQEVRVLLLNETQNPLIAFHGNSLIQQRVYNAVKAFIGQYTPILPKKVVVDLAVPLGQNVLPDDVRLVEINSIHTSGIYSTNDPCEVTGLIKRDDYKTSVLKWFRGIINNV